MRTVIYHPVFPFPIFKFPYFPHGNSYFWGKYSVKKWGTDKLALKVKNNSKLEVFSDEFPKFSPFPVP